MKRKNLIILLKNIFLENLWTKAVSVFLALLLWVYVTDDRNINFTFKVPVVYRNLAPGLVMTEKAAPVFAEVKIIKSRLRKIDGSALKKEINMKSAREPGRYEFESHGISFPDDAAEVKTVPEYIYVTIDRLAEKKVKLMAEADLSGADPEVKAAKTAVVPDHIIIKGPAGMLKLINSYPLPPIRVKRGSPAQFTEKVYIDIKEKFITISGDSSIKISVKLLKESGAEKK